MKRALSMMTRQMMTILYLVLLFFIVVTANITEKATIYNINNSSSLQAMHLIHKYDPEVVETLLLENFNNIAEFAPYQPVKYYGTMTGYGHDCEGCGNSVACAPYPIITDTIHFDDYQYGAVRILAADRKIPCGSIAIIRNSTEGEFVGIVLDRGGAIKGTLMDLLFENEAATYWFGRQNDIEYEIIRWGW